MNKNFWHFQNRELAEHREKQSRAKKETEKWETVAWARMMEEKKWAKGTHREKEEYDKRNFEIVEGEMERQNLKWKKIGSHTHINMWSCSWHNSFFELTHLTKAHLLIDWRVCQTWRLAGLWFPPPYCTVSPPSHSHTKIHTPRPPPPPSSTSPS